MPSLDFQIVAHAALAQAHILLAEWLPGGRAEGREYKALNPTRGDRRLGSFSVNLDSGAWADFATDDRGGDLVSLFAYLNGLEQKAALNMVAERVAVDPGGNGYGRPNSQASSRAASTWMPLVPVPADAPKAPDSLWQSTPHKRKPDAFWDYRDAAGQLLGLVCRWDTPGQERKKDIRPLTFCEGPGGAREWRFKSWPEPRPLYSLHLLAQQPETPVLVTEGEKAADAAQALSPDMVAITSPGGSKVAAKADWSALRGRSVVAWPDNDEPGAAYARDVARLAHEAGAASVRVVQVPEGFPPKWDLADPLPEGWTTEGLRQLLEQAQPWEPPAQEPTPEPAPILPGPPPDWPFLVNAEGVFKKFERENRQTGETKIEWVRVCSKLEVVAETRDDQGRAWGRLLEVTTREGNANTWTMPMSMLAGGGEEMRAELLSMGLEISPGTAARFALTEYISTTRPPERARCVERTGWHGPVFVLPDRAYGGAGDERVLYQSARAGDHAFRQAGALDDWQERLAKLCVGNSRLAFAVSAAFGAPLLHLTGMEGGGFHLRGGSSIGKSTALYVAGSAWGGGGVAGYLRSWRATSNGLEATALGHCHCLLALDEMGQVDGREAGEISYMLANGQGKTRSRRDGSGRPPAQWGVLLLSTGELSLAGKMNEAGTRAKAGQEVRLVDVPADAGAGLGLFEDLHGFESARAFADHLRREAGLCYGTPIRSFLEKVTANLEDLGQTIKQAVDEFVTECCPAGADGQVSRVAGRFGLVAAAGELAGAVGVLPWPKDEAKRAAAACFRAWLEQRGGAGPQELAVGIEVVRRFIQSHGSSRFEPWGGVEAARSLPNRVGFFREAEDGRREWYIFPAAFKTDVAQGHDANAVLKEFVRLKLMLPGKDDKPASAHRVPALGNQTVKLYKFLPAILGEE